MSLLPILHTELECGERGDSYSLGHRFDPHHRHHREGRVKRPPRQSLRYHTTPAPRPALVAGAGNKRSGAPQ